jgi:hypothetical protein
MLWQVILVPFVAFAQSPPPHLPVGHVIWPSVFMGVLAGRCSIAAAVPSSSGTMIPSSGMFSLESYLQVPSGCQENEIK